MKNTKILFRLAAILMTVVLLLSFAACNPADLAEENAEVREMTEDMIDAIIAGDKNAAYQIVPDIPQAEFDQAFDALYECLSTVESYTLTMRNINVNTVNGVTQYKIVYLLETNAGDYFLESGTRTDMKGLSTFQMGTVEDNTTRFTGTLTTMKGANVAQWVLLVIGMATYAFVIWALVDCIRRKLKQKWACILMIIFGSVAFLFTVQSSGVNFNFNFLNILSYTALMVYQNPPDALQLRIFVPVGAILYLALRHKWTIKDEAPPVPPVYGEGMNGGFMYTPAEAPVETSAEVAPDTSAEVPAEGQGSDGDAAVETVEQPADAPEKKEDT